MSYVVTTKKDFNGIEQGQEGNPIEVRGQRLYEFDLGDGNKSLWSWKYIKNHKDQFDISRSEK